MTWRQRSLYVLVKEELRPRTGQESLCTTGCMETTAGIRKILSLPKNSIVSPKKMEKLQPEKRREIFSGLQTFLSLVSTENLQGFLNFDDFKFTIPCKFSGDTKDRKVLNHKN